MYLNGGSIYLKAALMLHHLSFFFKHQIFLNQYQVFMDDENYLVFDDFPFVHVEVLEFSLVEFHEMLVLLCPLPPGLLIGRIDIDDFACHLVFQQMHLLLVLVHEVAHVDPILQIVVMFFLMVYQYLIYQFICLFLVERWNLFARRRKDNRVKVYRLSIEKKIVFSHRHHMQAYCAASLWIISHVKSIFDSYQACFRVYSIWILSWVIDELTSLQS